MSVEIQRGPGPRRSKSLRKQLLPIKMSPDEHRRFRVACAEEGVSYADMIVSLLDERDAKRERQRRAQAHPLHQPRSGPKSVYPGGSHHDGP